MGVFIRIAKFQATNTSLPLLVSTEQIEIKVSFLQGFIRKILKAILSQSECFLCFSETESTSLRGTKKQPDSSRANTMGWVMAAQW